MWFWEKCLPQVEPLPVSVTGHGGYDSSDDAKCTGRVERGGCTGSLQGPVLLDCLFPWSKSLEDCFGGPVILMASRGPRTYLCLPNGDQVLARCRGGRNYSSIMGRPRPAALGCHCHLPHPWMLRPSPGFWKELLGHSPWAPLTFGSGWVWAVGRINRNQVGGE